MSNPKLPQVVVDVLVLCLAPLFAGEGAEEGVDVAVGGGFAGVVKFGDQG